MKKILSIVLVVCFLFNGTITYAASTNSSSIQSNSYSQAEIAQIEKERQMLYDNLRAQLEAQDALDMLDYFSGLVDNTINKKYFSNNNTLRAARSLYWYAPNGGWIKGTGTNIKGEAHFFTPKQAEKLYSKRPTNTQTLVSALLSIGAGRLVGGIGDCLTAAICLDTLSQNMMWRNVDVGTDAVVVYSVYDTLDMKTTTVLWVWDQYPYMDSSILSLNKITKHGVN